MLVMVRNLLGCISNFDWQILHFDELFASLITDTFVLGPSFYCQAAVLCC